MAEALGFEEMINRDRAKWGAPPIGGAAAPEQNYKGKEAIGFEEMLQRDQEARRPKPTTPASKAVIDVNAVAVPTNKINELVERAKIIFSPPERASFEQIYAEINFTNMLSSSVKNNILTISTINNTPFSGSSHELHINVRTLLEILAQAMNTPINLPSELHIKSPPPFISNIKEITDYWISQMLCEYQKIFRLNDPRIEKMCHDYWLSMSYPILIRLAYLEWENKLVEWKVGMKVKEIDETANKKIRESRVAYAEQAEADNTEMKTRMNRALMEKKEETTKVNTIHERYNHLKLDLEIKKGEAEDLHDKWKAAEAIAEKAQAEKQKVLSDFQKLQTERDELKNTLEKVKETEWRTDFTYRLERPVFVNALDDTVVTFPCSMDEFKKKYKSSKKEGDTRKYTSEDGQDFSIPLSLALKIPKLIAELSQPLTNTEKGGKAEKEITRPPTQQKIIQHFNKNNEEQTTEDISAAIDVQQCNLYTHLKSLEEEGILTKKHSDSRGAKVYQLASH